MTASQSAVQGNPVSAPAGAEARPASPVRRRRRPEPPAPARPRSWSRRQVLVAVLLTPLAMWLAWRIFGLGLADFWATSDPDSALRWRPADPQALAAAAENAATAKDFRQADALAREAIGAYPLDGRGYRVLAQGRQFFGANDAAADLARLALTRSPRDVISRMLLLDQAAGRNDFSAALSQMDIVLRIRPDLASLLLPKLVAAASIPAVDPIIGRLLRDGPPWRLAYLQLLARTGTDPEAIDRVFAARGADEPLPPPQPGTEASLLLRRQIADGRWGAAYFTWVSTLSVEQRARLGNVYDGSFEFPAANQGFDWRFPEQGTGFDVEIGTAGDLSSDNALQLHFDGLPLDYKPVSQLLILGPGHYRFSAMGGASGLDTQEGGLSWTVTCAEGDRQTLAGTDFLSGDTPWGPLQMVFDVPATGCTAQWLRLDLNEGDFKGQALHGNAVFDNLRIDRIDAPGPAAGASAAAPGVAAGQGPATPSAGATGPRPEPAAGR